jgi:hypothetical protein
MLAQVVQAHLVKEVLAVLAHTQVAVAVVQHKQVLLVVVAMAVEALVDMAALVQLQAFRVHL